jgi:spermidine synthase
VKVPSKQVRTQGLSVLAAAVLLASGVLRAQSPAAGPRLVHQAPGMFGTVGVLDDGDDRYLVFGGPDGDQQSWIKKGRPGALPMEYLQSAAVALGQRPRRVLLIGLGGGAFATFTATRLPSTEIEAVEIDPAVAKVAREWFGLPESVVVHVADGAAFLKGSSERWDLILVDAYGSDDYPRHLGTPAFFASVRDHLTLRGIAVLNIAAMNKKTEADLVRRFNAVTERCFVIPVISDDADNTVLLGARRPLTEVQLRKGARDVARELRGVPVVTLARQATVCPRTQRGLPTSAPRAP